MKSEPITVTLAGHTYPLVWDGAALYRLQTLRDPPKLPQMFEPERSLKAVAEFVWACLDPLRLAWFHPRHVLTTPESIAAAIFAGPPGAIDACAEAVVRAIDRAAPKTAEQPDSGTPPAPATGAPAPAATPTATDAPPLAAVETSPAVA